MFFGLQNRGGGIRAKKSLRAYNGPLIFGSLFKISFFPRGKFYFVLGVLVVWPGWISTSLAVHEGSSLVL